MSVEHSHHLPRADSCVYKFTVYCSGMLEIPFPSLQQPRCQVPTENVGEKSSLSLFFIKGSFSCIPHTPLPLHSTYWTTLFFCVTLQSDEPQQLFSGNWVSKWLKTSCRLSSTAQEEERGPSPEARRYITPPPSSFPRRPTIIHIKYLMYVHITVSMDKAMDTSSELTKLDNRYQIDRIHHSHDKQ